MADVYVQAPVADDCTLEAFGSQPMNKNNFGPSCDDNESLSIKSPMDMLMMQNKILDNNSLPCNCRTRYCGCS